MFESVHARFIFTTLHGSYFAERPVVDLLQRFVQIIPFLSCCNRNWLEIQWLLLLVIQWLAQQMILEYSFSVAQNNLQCFSHALIKPATRTVVAYLSFCCRKIHFVFLFWWSKIDFVLSLTEHRTKWIVGSFMQMSRERVHSCAECCQPWWTRCW